MPARTADQTPRKTTVSAKSSTSSARKKIVRKKRRASRTPIQKAPTAERISEIQSALARGGYYPNDPNGRWDGDTVSALQKFQSANGLEPTGKLDALSLQKMGLGSEIAGVSAPRPLVHPSSLPASPVSGSSAPAGGTSPPDAPQR
jgi:peptidoglycan hydrolase-like protein with peptidoglycan-binding domain